ncbi:cold-shock protein [Chitinophaga alhagiae]|uniref:cold-shock protein n=1 Tax=Chitinophaga alhagiae TaxID=2203219 RepID=UPI001E3D27BA|nr:cold shock domain-containing protein [Chitinophaga alhagiae]
MRDRKLNNDKGKSLEDMLAFVDENGNLTPVPPKSANEGAGLHELATVARNRATPHAPPAEPARTGVISFFNTSKGFGFIADDNAKESVFFHANQLLGPVKEKDKVSFERERTSRGYNARNVKPVE